jgi:hypothetical protein
MFNNLSNRPDHQVRRILKKRKLYEATTVTVPGIRQKEYRYKFIQWETPEFTYFDDLRDLPEVKHYFKYPFCPLLFKELFDSPELKEGECSEEAYKRQQSLIKLFNERKRFDVCWEYPWYVGSKTYYCFFRPDPIPPIPRHEDDIVFDIDLEIMQEIDDEQMAIVFDLVHYFPFHHEVEDKMDCCLCDLCTIY